MSLVRYQPWNLFDQLHRDINRLFDLQGGTFGREPASVVSSGWMPAVDVHEEPDALVVLADVPGVDPDNIEVTANNGVLTIRGERRQEREINEDDFHRVERSYGSFFRQFTLPDYANADNITARTTDGVLEVRIPKTEKATPKRITIQH